MKILSLSEAKTQFSAVIKDVEAGNEIAVSYGKKRETIAVIVPYESWKKLKKRTLGSLKHKGKIAFGNDFHITDEEFLGK